MMKRLLGVGIAAALSLSGGGTAAASSWYVSVYPAYRNSKATSANASAYSVPYGMVPYIQAVQLCKRNPDVIQRGKAAVGTRYTPGSTGSIWTGVSTTPSCDGTVTERWYESGLTSCKC